MIAVDSSVLVDILVGSELAAPAEEALRVALGKGPVVICDVVLAEVCGALRDGDQSMQVIEAMGIQYRPIDRSAAIRAGEMQRRYRSRGDKRQRTVPDFLVGAHALLQCRALITQDGGFFRDYFKGLELIVPTGSNPEPPANAPPDTPA